MMIDSELVGRIESREKAVLLGSAASRRRFDAALVNDADIVGLMAAIAKDRHNAVDLADRVRALAEVSNPEYQHPRDIPLAVYLRVLDIVDPQLAESVAPRIAGLSNVWWARPLAIKLLEATRANSEAAQLDAARSFPVVIGTNAITRSDSSDANAFPDFREGRLYFANLTFSNPDSDFREHHGLRVVGLAATANA